MREIVWLWASTVAWLGLLPLLVPRELSPGPGVFGLGSLAAILVVTVPGLRKLELGWALLLALVFVAVGVLGTGAGGFPVGGLLGLGSLAIAVVLATRLGRKLVWLEGALDELAAGLPEERAEAFEAGQHDIYREIRRARRYERPASLLALSASGGDAPAARLLSQVRREFTQSYAQAQVAKLLSRETDAAAVITRRDRRFFVYLPETETEAAQQLALRLATAAADRWGLELRCAVASFPEEEVTFEGLLERAETALGELERAPWTPPLRQRKARTGLRLAEDSDSARSRDVIGSGSEG